MDSKIIEKVMLRNFTQETRPVPRNYCKGLRPKLCWQKLSLTSSSPLYHSP